MTQQPSVVQSAVVASAPVQKTYPVGCEAYRGLVSQYGWNVGVAMQVMHAESGCNPNAYGVNTDGSSDQGLFQVNSIHCASGLIACNDRTNPALNVQAAYRIYVGSGWRAWSVCKTKVVCN